MTRLDEQLIEQARQAGKNAYAPYSNFSVGAALLLADGSVVTGCNVENASYGLTICAERTAVYKAVSEGQREFAAIAVYADTDSYCSPCGACRQVIAEFGPQIRVIMANRRGEYKVRTIAELLPETFQLK
ncbi:MAG: cytidine deaminase [Bacillota bacterium]|jgi:cytidine deaminase